MSDPNSDSKQSSSPSKTISPISESVNEGWTKSTCAYCGVGCGIEAKLSETGAMLVRGDASHPANYGRLCSKGLALGETISDSGRLLTPSINGERVDWNSAIAHVADTFSETIKKHGPDSVAFYVSGQLLTEDYYVANKLMKGYIGSGNIDTNSRLCMSSSVAGHKRAFGTDTVPNCYEDFELADLVVLIGSNLAWCHPVIYQRLKAAKEKRPELKIVVVDPRETDSCEIADLHLAIQPGSDVVLFNGLLHYLADNQHLNHDYIEQHTLGFADALSSARASTKEGTDADTGESGVDFLALSKTTGVPIAYLETFYKWFAQTEKTLSVYSQGVNQSSAGTDKVNSIINCHLATGRIGKEGCGPFSITGQPNAMGGREVGGLANMLATHMEFGNDEHWQTVSDFWQTDTVAKKPGLKAVELFDAVEKGKIKAIWIMATNPVVSMPNADKVKKALEACPMVVVSDCIADTDTTRCANVLLPAMGWSEKSGTVTNSERRISRQRQLIASSGEAKADWWIMSQVALRMGYSGFNFTSDADVFREYATMTGFRNGNEEGPQRDLDISPLASLSDHEYEQLHPQQWPLKAIDQGQKRFFADGQFFSATGKANFIAVSHRPPMTQVSTDYPMVLNTGRIRDQWHTMTRTGLAPKLGAHKPEPYVQINPQDARCFGLNDGDLAQLSSKWGQAKARVVVSTEMNPGQLFMPMHWTAIDSSDGRVCPLVSPNVDPVSGQPEAKFTPVAITPWAIDSEALLIIHNEAELIEDLGEYDYWVKRRIENGTLYYLASAPSANDENKVSLAEKCQQLSVFTREGNSITFNSPATGSYRSAKVVNGELLAVCISATKINSGDYAWLDGLFNRDLDVDIQRSILSGVAAASLVSGKQICACKQVGELTIKNAIEKEGCSSAESIGACTGAGTGCGSCIPEINQLLNTYSAADLAKAV